MSTGSDAGERKSGARRRARSPAVRPPIRMADVAQRAGVSLITVSRVLREPERVAEATRKRVLDAVAAIGYVPNLVARSLKSRRSGIVAAIIPSVTHSIVADVTRGMNEVLRSEGLHLLLGDSGFSPQEEEALVTAFLARRCDALYITGTTHTEATCRMLAAARIPVVEAGALAPRPIDMTVGYSNRDAARAITDVLLRSGRRHVAYVGQAGRALVDRVQERHAGHCEALAARGLKLSPRRQVDVELSFRGGAAGVATLVERGVRFDAVFCTSDVIAVGVLFECQRRGLAVPDAVAVTGMDDQEIASQCVPALSTVRMPRFEMGRVAARLLCDRIAGKRPARTSIDLGFELALRETT